MDSILATIPKVFRDIETDESASRALIFAAWTRIAGDGIRRNALPVELDGSTLIVAVRDATWNTNLRSLAPQLIARLNSELGTGSVKYLDFATEPDRFAPILRAVKEDDVSILAPGLITAAEAISDPKLRRSFLSAAAAYMARKEAADEHYGR